MLAALLAAAAAAALLGLAPRPCLAQDAASLSPDLLGPPLAPSSRTVSQHDIDLLLAFQDSFEDGAAVLGWLNGSDPCAGGWRGVHCDFPGVVSDL